MLTPTNMLTFRPSSLHHSSSEASLTNSVSGLLIQHSHYSRVFLCISWFCSFSQISSICMSLKLAGKRASVSFVCTDTLRRCIHSAVCCQNTERGRQTQIKLCVLLSVKHGFSFFLCSVNNKNNNQFKLPELITHYRKVVKNKQTKNLQTTPVFNHRRFSSNLSELVHQDTLNPSAGKQDLDGAASPKWLHTLPASCRLSQDCNFIEKLWKNI